MLNYSIKIIQRIILFAFILLLTFNMAGCKRNTITIQYMLEVPNLHLSKLDTTLMDNGGLEVDCVKKMTSC